MKSAARRSAKIEPIIARTWTTEPSGDVAATKKSPQPTAAEASMSIQYTIGRRRNAGANRLKRSPGVCPGCKDLDDAS